MQLTRLRLQKLSLIANPKQTSCNHCCFRQTFVGTTSPGRSGLSKPLASREYPGLQYRQTQSLPGNSRPKFFPLLYPVELQLPFGLAGFEPATHGLRSNSGLHHRLTNPVGEQPTGARIGMHYLPLPFASRLRLRRDRIFRARQSSNSALRV